MAPKKMSLEEARKHFQVDPPKKKFEKKPPKMSKISIKKKIENLEKELMFGDLTQEKEEAIMKEIGSLEKQL